jgi:hypothetical protein
MPQCPSPRESQVADCQGHGHGQGHGVPASWWFRIRWAPAPVIRKPHFAHCGGGDLPDSCATSSRRFMRSGLFPVSGGSQRVFIRAFDSAKRSPPSYNAQKTSQSAKSETHESARCSCNGFLLQCFGFILCTRRLPFQIFVQVLAFALHQPLC